MLEIRFRTNSELNLTVQVFIYNSSLWRHF